MLPICIKPLYQPPFLYLRKLRALGLTKHQVNANFWANVTQQSRQIWTKRIKIMVADLWMKPKPKLMLEVIRSPVLDFVLYFVTVW